VSKSIRAFLTPLASGRVARTLETTQLIQSIWTSKLLDVQRSSLLSFRFRLNIIFGRFSCFLIFPLQTKH
jgi:hypothetical protein